MACCIDMGLEHSCSLGPSPATFEPHRSRTWLLLRPLLTSRSRFPRRPFRHEASSPQVRTHTFIAQPPHLRHHSLDHESFAVSCPLALLDSAFYAVLVHRLTIYAPRFLPTIGRPFAVALRFVCCDQLTTGLAPVGVRPCWAHMKKGAHGALRSNRCGSGLLLSPYQRSEGECCAYQHQRSWFRHRLGNVINKHTTEESSLARPSFECKRQHVGSWQ